LDSGTVPMSNGYSGDRRVPTATCRTAQSDYDWRQAPVVGKGVPPPCPPLRTEDGTMRGFEPHEWVAALVIVVAAAFAAWAVWTMPGPADFITRRFG